MCRLEAGTLRERKAAAQRREQQFIHALTSRKKSFECVRRKSKQKKKAADELIKHLDLKGIEGKIVRQPEGYRPKSYNLDRQLIGLLRHMFVEYSVPACLYGPCMRKADPFSCMHETYRQWFVTLAQGGSFPKLVKWFMTSREAFLFLSAPPANLIHENVWWAKMRAAGLPREIVEKLIDRVFHHFFFDDPNGRLAEAIQFYARFHQEMDKVTFGEVNDFVAWKLHNEPEFSLKGRTAGSVIKLTNEWHAQMQRARLYSIIEWAGLQIPDWEMVTRNGVWSVAELRTNRDLLMEGRKQKHCIYSYVQRCVSGMSAIFSLRGYPQIVAGYAEDGQVIWEKSAELTRVTIEVNDKGSVVQMRGRLNRMPTEEENKYLRLWADDQGIRIADGR